MRSLRISPRADTLSICRCVDELVISMAVSVIEMPAFDQVPANPRFYVCVVHGQLLRRSFQVKSILMAVSAAHTTESQKMANRPISVT